GRQHRAADRLLVGPLPVDAVAAKLHGREPAVAVVRAVL
ncbi:hypothetical protein BN1708_020230, partial [Verticillium longisporum]